MFVSDFKEKYICMKSREIQSFDNILIINNFRVSFIANIITRVYKCVYIYVHMYIKCLTIL